MKEKLWPWIQAFCYPLPWALDFINYIAFKLTRIYIPLFIGDTPESCLLYANSEVATLSMIYMLIHYTFPLLYIFYIVKFYKTNKPMLVFWLLHGLIGFYLWFESGIRYSNFLDDY